MTKVKTNVEIEINRKFSRRGMHANQVLVGWGKDPRNEGKDAQEIMTFEARTMVSGERGRENEQKHTDSYTPKALPPPAQVEIVATEGEGAVEIVARPLCCLSLSLGIHTHRYFAESNPPAHT